MSKIVKEFTYKNRKCIVCLNNKKCNFDHYLTAYALIPELEELYDKEVEQEPENTKFKVWDFVIDKAISFDDVNDLYFFYPHILDKEITDFTIVNQLDYDIEPKYAREGINVYPKTIVYIYTEDWNKYENRC